jgi:ankyrin repeat protein
MAIQHGRTELMAAIVNQNIGEVQNLIDLSKGSGAIDAVNTHGQTALFYAVNIGSEPIIRLLVNAGADINHRDPAGDTVLNWAIASGKKAVISLLIQCGADIAMGNHLDVTPLMNAARSGDLSLVNLLLAHGAVANCRDAAGWTGVHYALKYGHTQCAMEIDNAAGGGILKNMEA